MNVIFSPEKKVPIKTFTFEYFDDVVLNPGINELDEMQYKTLKNNDIYQYYLTNDVIIEQIDDVKKSTTKSVKQAIN